MGRKVFVGNVPYLLKQEKFIEHFKSAPGFERAYLVFNRDKPGENKGFGFVIFEDPDNASSCAELEHIIDGDKLDCRIHDSKSETYFVQRIQSLTEKDVREYFEKLGVIERIQMHENKGFAFVTIKLLDDGIDLFSMNHSELCQGCEVKKARKRGEGRGRGRGRGGYGSWRGRGDYGYQPSWGPPQGGWGGYGGYGGQPAWSGRGRGGWGAYGGAYNAGWAPY